MSTEPEPATPDLLTLNTLRERHTRLMTRRRAAQEDPPVEAFDTVLDDAERFVADIQIAGRLLESDDERGEAQGLLSYWANLLYRVGRPVAEDILDEFDPLLAPAIPDERCPYLGLDAFSERDAERFFGRRRVIEQLAAQLADHRLVALIGPSGSGKSSVVRAGLLPALQFRWLPESGDWHYLPVMVPGAHPLAQLAAAQARLAKPGQALVLTIDQFEETFTLCTDEAERAEFLAALIALASDATTPHRVILTMRSDFEPFVARAESLLALFEAGKAYLPPMSASELRAAIELPAEQVGLRFEPGVVDALLQEIVGEPAALPLLQFTLLKLWEHRERNRITLAAYRAVGGGRLALARAADTLYASLIPEEQVTARRILLRLVRPGEGLEVTSNRVRRADLLALGEDPGRVERVLGRLLDARLLRLTTGATQNDDQVEVAHEALVRNWPTLVEWLEDERVALRQRQRLTTAAEQWERLGRDAGALWRGLQLGEAARYTDLSLLEREFVQAALDEQERVEHEREATIQRLEQLTTELEQQRRLIDTQRLAFAAQSLANDNPELAVLLALEAAAAEDSPVTQQALRDALTRACWQPTTLRGHKGAVRSIAFSPNGQYVATASIDSTARLWSAVGEEVAVLQGHSKQVWTIAFSPDGTKLLTSSLDGSARLWDFQGACLAVLDDHAEGVSEACFSPDGQCMATGCGDGSVYVWSIDGNLLMRLIGHTGDTRTVAFSPNSLLIASGSDDGTARLWDADGECIAIFKHQGYVRRVVFHPDRPLLLTASFDKTAKLWTLEGAEVATLTGHTDLLWSALFTYDGRNIVTASQDGTVRVWDLTGIEIESMRDHTNLIQQISCSPDKSLILSASHDRTARLWKRGAKQTTILSGHTGFVRSVALSPDSEVLATASEDGTARLWRPAIESQIALRGHQQTVRDAVYDPTGQYIATASSDGTARIWSVGGDQLAVLAHDGATVYSIAYTPDGSRIITGASDGRVRVWSIEGYILNKTEGYAQVRRVAVSPDGLQIAAGYKDGVVRLYELEALDTAEPKTLTVQSESITYTVFSPDGRYLAVGGRSNNSHILPLSASPIIELRHGRRDYKWVFNLAWSPDGTQLVTTSADHTARIWTLDGQQLAVLRGHTDWVMATAWSPDGKLIITGSADRTLWIWTSTGERLSAIHNQPGTINSVAFSPDSRRIIVTSADSVASQHIIKTSDLLQLAACRVGRGLTEEEIARFSVPAPLKFEFANRQCPPVFLSERDRPATL